MFDNTDFVNLPSMLSGALEEELFARRYYENLINRIESERDKIIISDFIEDEKRHYFFLYNLFQKLFGYDPVIPLPKHADIVSFSYKEGIENAFFNEIRTCRLHHNIYLSLETSSARDILSRIITDENEHALKLCFLFCKKS